MKQFWKLSLMLLGGTFLILGIIGIFFPILPTTPFLLLSASCFLRSSHVAYRWLMTNKILGKYIFQYRITKAIPLQSKIAALTLLWLGILISIFIVPILWVKVLLFIIAFCVTVHILLIKTMTVEDKLLFKMEYQRFLENDCPLPNNKEQIYSIIFYIFFWLAGIHRLTLSPGLSIPGGIVPLK